MSVTTLWHWVGYVLGALTLAGVVAALVLPGLRNRIFTKDYLAGLLFQAFGVGTLLVAGPLSLGSAVRMGPGYVPRLLGFILIAIGAVISLRAAMAPSEQPERGYWRPFLLCSATVLSFAFLFDFAGLIPAVIGTILVAAAAGYDQRWGQTAISVVFLVALCVGVFKYALGLPMPLFELKV